MLYDSNFFHNGTAIIKRENLEFLVRTSRDIDSDTDTSNNQNLNAESDTKSDIKVVSSEIYTNKRSPNRKNKYDMEFWKKLEITQGFLLHYVKGLELKNDIIVFSARMTAPVESKTAGIRRIIMPSSYNIEIHNLDKITSVRFAYSGYLVAKDNQKKYSTLDNDPTSALIILACEEFFNSKLPEIYRQE